MQIESPRFFVTDELRVIEADGKAKIVGYAAVYNSLSEDLGGFREQIAPGAFADAVKPDAEILALRDHDPKMILARRSAGTLSIRDDGKGLLCEITPPDTNVGRDAVADVRCGNIRGMSFRFGGAKDTWAKGADGVPVRTLTKIARVPEVTITPIPAYPGTSAALRALWGDDDAARAYYKQQIDALDATPARDRAERMLRMMAD